MNFELTSEQQQLVKELHEYMAKKAPPGLYEELVTDSEGGGPLCSKFKKQLGSDGWLGVGWPKEYGGQARSPLEQYIFFDIVCGYYGVTLPILTLNTIGPTLMRVGTEEQKKRILPGILKGEIEFAVGYTEPEAGSDLASLKTSATRDGDYYIINGQKSFTSQAHISQYIWLATRTDPKVPKHKGISLFMVDTKLPGVEIQPMKTMGDFETNSTFYDNVKVHKDCLIGGENRGWSYINDQLALERIAMVPHSMPLRYLEDIIKWLKETGYDKRGFKDYVLVKNELAEMAIETELLRVLNFRVAWMLTQGRPPHKESAMIKVFGSEHIQRLLGNYRRITGLYGQLVPGSMRVPISGKLESMSRYSVVMGFAGGANEVLRDVVATVGLMLPRAQ